MQIDCEVVQVKKYRILGPSCCDTMGNFLKNSFDSNFGVVTVFTGGLNPLYFEAMYCPFCGEKITSSVTY
jgi:hypothetical protein